MSTKNSTSIEDFEVSRDGRQPSGFANPLRPSNYDTEGNTLGETTSRRSNRPSKVTTLILSNRLPIGGTWHDSDVEQFFRLLQIGLNLRKVPVETKSLEWSQLIGRLCKSV